jgi:hypothetical protein
MRVCDVAALVLLITLRLGPGWCRAGGDSALFRLMVFIAGGLCAPVNVSQARIHTSQQLELRSTAAVAVVAVLTPGSLLSWPCVVADSGGCCFAEHGFRTAVVYWRQSTVSVRTAAVYFGGKASQPQ